MLHKKKKGRENEDQKRDEAKWKETIKFVANFQFDIESTDQIAKNWWSFQNFSESSYFELATGKLAYWQPISD